MNSINSAADFKAFRLSHGFTQVQVAELLYVNIRKIENWEQGISPLPRGYMELLEIKVGRLARDHE